EVRNVEDDRLSPSDSILVDEVVHPGTTALLVTLPVVSIEKSKRLSILIEHLEHANVWVVDRDVLTLLERQAVKLVRREEQSILKNVVDLEVRLELRFIESVPRLSHLLRIVLVIPRCELESALLAVDELLHIGNLGACPCNRRGNEIGEK